MYGRQSVASPLPGSVARRADVAVRGRDSRDPMSGYSPRARVSVGYDVGVGAAGDQACALTRPPNAPNAKNAWCYDYDNITLMVGSGRLLVPAGATIEFTWTLVEAVIIKSVSITDPSGQLIVTSAKTGRVDFVESGGFSTDSIREDNTLCKVMAGARAYPSSGVRFLLNNPTLAPVFASVNGTVIPIPCEK